MDCIDGLKQLDDESVDCIVTSPPYWNLRRYSGRNYIGFELSREYVDLILKRLSQYVLNDYL